MRTSLRARDKYSSWFGRHRAWSGKKMEAIETNSVTSMEIFSAFIPLTSGTKSAFRGHWGTLCFCQAATERGALLGGTCPVPGRYFHRLESEILKHFAFFLNLHFCVLTEHCRFFIFPFCTLLRRNYVLQSSLFFNCGRADPEVWFCFFWVTCWLLWLGVRSPMEYLLISFPPGCWEAEKSLSAVIRHPDIAAFLLTCAR